MNKKGFTYLIHNTKGEKVDSFDSIVDAVSFLDGSDNLNTLEVTRMTPQNDNAGITPATDFLTQNKRR